MSIIHKRQNQQCRAALQKHLRQSLEAINEFILQRSLKKNEAKQQKPQKYAAAHCGALQGGIFVFYMNQLLNQKYFLKECIERKHMKHYLLFFQAVAAGNTERLLKVFNLQAANRRWASLKGGPRTGVDGGPLKECTGQMS